MQVDKLNKFVQFQRLNVCRWSCAFPIDLHWDHVLQCQCFTKFFKSLLHLVLGLSWFLVCPWGIQNVMRVVQQLSVILVTYDQAQFHLSLLIVSMISCTLVFFQIQRASSPSRHVMFSIIRG